MTDAMTLSARLKSETQSLHTLAERHPIQRELVGGGASVGAYTRYLAQMFRAHEGLESSLREAVGGDAALGALVREHHYRLDQLRDDLNSFDIDSTDTAASVATARFALWTRRLAESRPVTLIGVLYVLEGSTNGGRYIARAIRRGLGLSGARGAAYLDPHGEEQAQRWGAFKETLDSLELDEPSQLAIIAGARETFAAIIAIMDDLQQSEPMPAASALG